MTTRLQITTYAHPIRGTVTLYREPNKTYTVVHADLDETSRQETDFRTFRDAQEAARCMARRLD